MALKEGAAHPCDAKDGDHGIHARGKDVALHGLPHVGLADEEYQGGDAHHHHLYDGTHVQRNTIEGRSQGWENAEEQHQHLAKQKCQDSPTGMGVRMLGIHIFLRFVSKIALFEAPLIFRVFLQGLAHIVLHQRGYQYGHDGGWYGDHHDIHQANAFGPQHFFRDDSCRSCRHGRSRTAQ